MTIPAQSQLARILVIMPPLLCAAAPIRADPQCHGYKIVQSCTTIGGAPNVGQCAAYINDVGGAMYPSCIATAPLVGGIRTCSPIQVPCSYPDDVVDAISRLLAPAR